MILISYGLILFARLAGFHRARGKPLQFCPEPGIKRASPWFRLEERETMNANQLRNIVMSRRAFLKAAGLTAGGAVLAACAAPATTAPTSALAATAIPATSAPAATS